MKTATGLTLVAIGAILAFAVTTNTSVFNLHVAGFVIMLFGLAGIFIPKKQYSSLSRRLVQRRTRSWPSGTVTETETTLPPYVVQNPGGQEEQTGARTIPSIPPDATVRRVMTPGETVDTETIRDPSDD